MSEKRDKDDEQPLSWELRIFNLGSKALYIVAAFALQLLALAMVGSAIWAMTGEVWAGKPFLAQLLDSVGLIIIAFAVFDVAKFLLEEQVVKERELARISEARRSLTMFFTIIIIAVSLEALVIVFQNKDEPYLLFYPAALLAVAVFALIGLGLFQWLTRHAEETREDSADVDPEKEEDGEEEKKSKDK
ncbi:MAG: hypothetical protein H0V62_10070 [Gammaproteobacteria bacterium]|nr:hypothetical protein [Gammaproteobacteria bacterium]MBA3732333.1 hypothetical protein [Gammaproteobacteria bacterium]